MSLSKLVFLVSLSFLIYGCSSNHALATGDELIRNELCGVLVDYGDDSCKFIKEINLYSAIRREEYNDITKKSAVVIDDLLNKWEVENNKKFLAKKINIYHKAKRAPLEKAYGPEAVINVYFWLVEIKDKNMLDVIFFSRSKNGQIITSRQCELDSDFNVCVKDTVNDLLDSKVSSQIFNHLQYETLK